MFNKSISITQKNFLLFLYLFILGLCGFTIYMVSNSQQVPFIKQKNSKASIKDRISLGEKILVKAHSSSDKQAGVEAFAKGDYAAAQEYFRVALKGDRGAKSKRNDPEARIYLNNTIAAKSEKPQRIAVSVPIGGDLAVAEEILRGVAQAQERINDNGGINGKLLMVKIANDDNDVEIGRQVAENLIEDKKVLAVVGHNSSNVSIAAAPLYEEAEVVMITPTSSAETLSKLGNYIFRTSPSTRGLADTIADYAVNTLGKNKIGICVDSAAKASVSFKENFTWAVYNYGGQVAPIDCDFSASDFQGISIPSQAVSQGIDTLLLAPSVRKVDRAMEIVTANQDRLTLLGNHSLNTYATLKQGQNSAKGMVLAVPWYSQKNDGFAKDARQLWGGSVNWRTAMAYDATKTLARAMVSGVDRKAVQQALTNPSFRAKGATADINFLPSGDRNLKGTLVQIKPGKRSGTGFDFSALSE